MQYKKSNLSTVLLLGFYLTGLHAQETILPSGGNTSGSGGSVSYSVGQVVYSTYSGSNGSITQGVQQPYEISVISGIEKIQGVCPEYSVFPNPTTNKLTLKIENIEKKKYIASLFDIDGKLLSKQIILSDETNIPVEQYSASTYLLKISEGNNEVITFKIIKK